MLIVVTSPLASQAKTTWCSSYEGLWRLAPSAQLTLFVRGACRRFACIGAAGIGKLARKSLCPGGGMADTTVLEAVAVRRAGSSPVLGTINGLRVVGDFDVTCSYTLSYTGSWL